MSTVYEIITDRIVKQLETGTVPWQRPWKVRGKNGLPRNLVTGREYRGVNLWVLLSSEYSSPFWLTYRQARELEGRVRQGEHGYPVVYWRFGKREVQDGDQLIEKPSVLVRYFTVFNVEQCEELRVQPSDPIRNESEPEPIESCEQVVAAWREKPTIKHGGCCASYNKVLDLVQMPERSCFKSAEEYYSTLFHEMAHSTGHPSRLNRSSLTEFEGFGDACYSREELVAEMGAAFLAGYCGIDSKTLGNSASYVASWLEAVKQDSRMIVIAASQAQKAADLILGMNPASTTP